ncbi:hypothetical protein V8E36_008991 [Tilletia maclaganii]
MAFSSSLAASCGRCASRLPSSAGLASRSFDLSALRHSLGSTSAYRPAAVTGGTIAATSAQARTFSQSAPALEKRRKRLARLKRKSNLERRELTSRLLASSKPDPVLGHMTGAAARAASSSASSVVNANANEQAIAAGLAPTTGGEEVWSKSELARLILSHDEVWGVREDRRGELIPIDQAEFQKARGSGGSGGKDSTLPGDELSAQAQAEFGGPLRLNFGLKTTDRELLFSELPRVMVEDRMLDSVHLRPVDKYGDRVSSSSKPFAPRSDDAGTQAGSEAAAADRMLDERTQLAMVAEMEELERAEAGSADVLARVLDLRNASARGIRYENTRRIVEAFGRPLPNGQKDSGVTEVQVALLTYRIRNMYSHLANARHDNHNRRQMNMMVHKRAKLLKYLKRTEPVRYQKLLPRVGLLPRAVEGELVLPGKPKVSRM